MPEASEQLLEVRKLNAHYGRLHVLYDVNYEVHRGEIVCLLGGNASGKSTTMKVIVGLLAPSSGEVHLCGSRIDELDMSERIKKGIGIVPEGRRIFARMTVLENLELGGFLCRDAGRALEENLERVTAMFPRLRERRSQVAGTLSGGEQQMLAIARALMSRPRLLCMDEPSMGLSPGLVEQVFDIIREINKTGTSIFVVEQNATMALSIADRGYVLQTGRIVAAGKGRELLANNMVRRAYLGEDV